MVDLRKLNSATKYPSIPTYHKLAGRGRLSEEVQVPFEQGPIWITEKVDGANGRIVVLPFTSPIVHAGSNRAYIIGSREEFLSAENDLVYPADYGIVDALRPLAQKLRAVEHEDIRVYFFEVFGGDLPASKQYTSGKLVAARLFDVARVDTKILDMPIEKIAEWRDHGGQEYMTWKELIDWRMTIANVYDAYVEIVPRLGCAVNLPTKVEEVYAWLKKFEKTECNMGNGLGKSEGVIVRSGDRKKIAKIRFEDYERTLKDRQVTSK